jgi:hypothetical protein
MRWAVFATFLIGCSGGDGTTKGSDSGEPAGCTAQDLTVEVGTGELEYEPLEDGDPVTLVYGPQGGWHIWFSVLTHFSESEVKLLPVVTETEMGVTVTPEDQQELFVALEYDEPACEGRIAGQRAFVDASRDTGPSDIDFICALEGRTLEMTVTATDILSGRTSTDTVNVTAALDPVDVPKCN